MKNHNLKKILFSVILFSILILSGCAKLVSTEETKVQVKIVDESYKPEDILPMYNGKDWYTMIEPAEYNIFVEYKGEQYEINDKDTYEKYADKIGEYANGTLRTKKYDDGSERYKIIGLD